MRGLSWRYLRTALVLAVAGTGLVASRASAAEETSLKGTWKLVVSLQPLNDTDLFVLDFKPEGDALTATVGAAQPGLEKSKVTRIERKDGKVALDVQIGGLATTFSGKPDKNGKIYGLLDLRGRAVPSRLERGDNLAPEARGGPLVPVFLEARNTKDAKARVRKYGDLTEKDPGGAKLAIVYAELLKSATEAGLSEQQVKNYLDEWFNGAKRYGEAYDSQMKSLALEALSGQKPYAGLAVNIAEDVDKSIGESAPIEARAKAASALAQAAKLAGKSELAASASAKATKLEGALDEEFHKKVPPFKPEAFAGRKEKANDRVVLLELFTGAQCPPCVAADVAFDAVNQTYTPTEVIGLQYHLHIPGPDPLTNPDSVARAEYYPDLQGTPGTYFNGKEAASGGGSLANSQDKSKEYRELIDKAIEAKKQAKIDLKVERSGDEIKIVATAHADNAKGADKASKLRLRLALIEEQVRYPGGNGMRFHHHIVRAMPGGVAGKEMAGGEGKAEVTVKLSELRGQLEAYLSDFAKKSGGFPGALPDIKLEKLSVVAFVQDDADKSVLHAVLAPAGGESK